MSKPKYLPTPGPWAVPNTDHLIDKPTLVWSHDGLVCEVKNHNREANACLIAAAPDLLEALKRAVEDCPCSFKERDSGHRIGCRASEWHELIAKAEGKTS